MKTYYRYFGALLDLQEKFLNSRAKMGYRLIDANKLSYVFEACDVNEYQYAVDFVAHKSDASSQNYKEFLEDIGYRTFYKNMNLNYSIGKVKWRPYAKGGGQIGTNGGTYNKELIIVEKKNDGKPFALHTTNEDKVGYYKSLRNMWCSLFVLLAILVAMGELFLFALALPFVLVPTALYQHRVLKCKNSATIEQ